MQVVIRSKQGNFFRYFLRNNIRQLMADINKQKAALKKHGLWVDGKHYRFNFTGKGFKFY